MNTRLLAAAAAATIAASAWALLSRTAPPGSHAAPGSPTTALTSLGSGAFSRRANNVSVLTDAHAASDATEGAASDPAQTDEIRPEVRTFLDEHYPDPAMRAAMAKIAAAQELSITQGSLSREQASVVFTKSDRAMSCVLKTAGLVPAKTAADAQHANEIISRSLADSKAVLAVRLKTRADVTAYARYMSNLSGQTFSRPEGDPCVNN